MLSHFHGIQHADDHKRIYQGLDVEIDIAKGRVISGQFVILKFNFSTINRSTNIEDANTFPKTNIANSLRLFYKTYSPYLGGNENKLFDNIDREDPSSSLLTCIESVRDAILTARERGGGSDI